MKIETPSIGRGKSVDTSRAGRLGSDSLQDMTCILRRWLGGIVPRPSSEPLLIKYRDNRLPERLNRRRIKLPPGLQRRPPASVPEDDSDVIVYLRQHHRSDTTHCPSEHPKAPERQTIRP